MNLLDKIIAWLYRFEPQSKTAIYECDCCGKYRRSIEDCGLYHLCRECLLNPCSEDIEERMEDLKMSEGESH